MRRLEQGGIALGVLLLAVLPTALHGWPATREDLAFTLLLAAGGLALMWWRISPRVASVTALGLFLAALVQGDGWFPATASALFSCSFVVLALGWSGRAAWLVTACAAAYLVPVHYLAEQAGWAAILMFTVPPYAAGTVLRLRKETAYQLAVRAHELDEERELFAEIALRHERENIAGELHDIVGHAISVMVIQAAAGQRLAVAHPERAKEAFAAISESARQGTADLDRLVELLGGAGVTIGPGGGPDLSLVDELVGRAARSGLDVTCRFEGQRDLVSAPVAHLAFRVVQEGLTNALRYAPGSQVRVLLRADAADRVLVVRVENESAAHPLADLGGTGQGLAGLRERAQRLGGQLSAGATAQGWVVEARLPAV
jgi:signal transduction histidine kinase